MARVVHFEITADDVERARKFHEILRLGDNELRYARRGLLAGPHRRGRYRDKWRDRCLGCTTLNP